MLLIRQQANALLSKNKSIQIRLEVEKLKKKPLAEKKDFFAKILTIRCLFFGERSDCQSIEKMKISKIKKTLLQSGFRNQKYASTSSCCSNNELKFLKILERNMKLY